MVSKAAVKSNKHKQVILLRLLAVIKLSYTDNSVVSVEWNFVYADWNLLYSELLDRCSSRRVLIIFSIILEMKDRLEIGL